MLIKYIQKPGPGLLESAYENALAYDLRELGFEVKQQIPMPLYIKMLNRILDIELTLW